jgi:hypothetical protein
VNHLQELIEKRPAEGPPKAAPTARTPGRERGSR